MAGQRVGRAGVLEWGPREAESPLGRCLPLGPPLQAPARDFCTATLALSTAHALLTAVSTATRTCLYRSHQREGQEPLTERERERIRLDSVSFLKKTLMSSVGLFAQSHFVDG